MKRKDFDEICIELKPGLPQDFLDQFWNERPKEAIDIMSPEDFKRFFRVMLIQAKANLRIMKIAENN